MSENIFKTFMEGGGGGRFFFFCFNFKLTSMITPRIGPVHALEKYNSE